MAKDIFITITAQVDDDFDDAKAESLTTGLENALEAAGIVPIGTTIGDR